ncbi:hypothetical protein VTN31DRAFT_3313 [Thermomyces dupontii]|uniref:uncharacterized protein n=1 Tax=Talaromyces thermophilus TaxID=28565 RepID=UPI00374380C3
MVTGIDQITMAMSRIQATSPSAAVTCLPGCSNGLRPVGPWRSCRKSCCTVAVLSSSLTIRSSYMVNTMEIGTLYLQPQDLTILADLYHPVGRLG